MATITSPNPAAKTRPFQTDDQGLRPIHDKVMAGKRLSEGDAITLYRSGDILAIGWLANYVRERMHGDVAYFNVNRHINYTNVCVAACRLCAFGRKKESEGSYTMALEQVWETAGSGYTEAITEFHIVGGLHADLPFQYYLDLISGLKERFPGVHLKAFTMVEISFFAKIGKMTPREVLVKFKEAGLDSMPGGGAEIFSDRVRHIICDHKIDGDDWLAIARAAHEVGLKSNATMLYGHVENDEDRVDHLLKLRALQDDTHGFQTFIPLAFHPENTPLQHLPKIDRHARSEADCGVATGARQLPAHQVVLADGDAEDRADLAALRCRRHRRHRHRRENLSRCRSYHPSGLEPSRTHPADY